MIEIRTLLLNLATINIALTLVMLIYWRTQKSYSGFGEWILCNISGFTGYILLAGRGYFSDTFSILFGNLFLFYVGFIRLESLRRFLGETKPNYINYIIPLFLLPFLAYFLLIKDNIAIRTIYITSVLFFISVYMGYYMKKSKRQPHTILYKSMALVFYCFAIVLLFRCLSWILVPEINSLLSNHILNQISFYLLIVCDISLTFIFLLMNQERLSGELITAQEQLKELAMKDPLTGINNRRIFLELGQSEWERHIRYTYPLSFVMIDIDHFKVINDTYGHATGDKVLIQIASEIEKAIRTIDLFARLGGEEFGILLPHTSLHEAIAFSERLRKIIEAKVFSDSNNPISLTISLGVAEAQESCTDLQQLVKRADESLYHAKQTGRNKVGCLEYPAT